LAVRDVVIDPMPGWLAIAAGAGAVRAAAAKSRGLVRGLSILSAISPAVQRIKEAADAVTGVDVQNLLGFNPLEVLAQVLGRSSPSGSKPNDERVP
jgi:hypothetical protein